MRSVVDRNVVMRLIAVLWNVFVCLLVAAISNWKRNVRD
jgi:hypothetical protein